MEINNRKEIIPFAATHPTEIIIDEIKARGMTRKELAERMGMRQPNLSRLLKGENITSSIAAKLETALDIPADIWMRLQIQYDKDTKTIEQRDKKEKEAIATEMMLSSLLNLPELYKRLGINTCHFIQKKLEVLEEMLRFNPLEIRKMSFVRQSLYKKSDKLNSDERNQNTWLTLAYINAMKDKPEYPYKKGNAIEAAKSISEYAHKGALTETLIKQVLNNNGIAYSVVPKLDKTPIDAVSMMVGETPSIVTTHRYNDMSKLVFNVLHEAGHIELHFNTEGGENLFISSDETYSTDNPKEKEANSFAEDMLIDRNVWKKMMESEVNGISTRNIVNKLKSLSKIYGLDFNIVAWRYRYESHNYRIYGIKPSPIR